MDDINISDWLRQLRDLDERARRFLDELAAVTQPAADFIEHLNESMALATVCIIGGPQL